LINRKIVILIFLILLTITVNLFNLVKSSEKELKEEIELYKKFITDAKKVISLKEKFSQKNYSRLLNRNFCKVSKLEIRCSNLPKRELRKVSLLLKSNIKIKSFEIEEKNSKYNFRLEFEE